MAFRTYKTLGEILKKYQLTLITSAFPVLTVNRPAPLQLHTDIAFTQLTNGQKPVYGIVSNGEVWEIGLLEASTLRQYRDRFDINRLDELFSALTCVPETCKRIYNL